MSQNTSRAVMAQRAEAPDSLDFFPTPPWATRALCEVVLPHLALGLQYERVWEPAAGEGHMAAVLAEYASEVIASDVHKYERWIAGADARHVGSFIGAGPDVLPIGWIPDLDWIITNPPFNLAEQFFERARNEARGVAFLVRTTWLESKERYERIFSQSPPNMIALFSERVPMVKGRWDPKASTATSYAWVVWARSADLAQASLRASCGPRLMWIPPGQRQRLTLPADYERFAREAS